MGNKILSIVGIILSIGGPIVIILAGIINWINDAKASKIQRKKNKEWMAEHNYTTRKLCTSCPYCRYSYYHPFYTRKYRNVLVSKSPRYCSKLHLKLNGDSMSRCIAKDASQAMWEKTSEDYFADLNRKWTPFEGILAVLMTANLIIFVFKILHFSVALKISVMCLTGSLILLLVVQFLSAFDVVENLKGKQAGYIAGTITFMLVPSILIGIFKYNVDRYLDVTADNAFISTLMLAQSPFFETSIILLIIESILIIASIVIAIIGYRQDEHLREQIIEERKQQKKKEVEAKLAQRTNILNKLVGDNHLSFLHLPDDVFFFEDGTPIKGDITALAPYGDYTVYTTKSGQCFHSVYNCSGATIPKHLLYINRTHCACRKCSYFLNLETPEWFLIYTKNRKQ